MVGMQTFGGAADQSPSNAVAWGQGKGNIPSHATSHHTHTTRDTVAFNALSRATDDSHKPPTMAELLQLARRVDELEEELRQLRQEVTELRSKLQAPGQFPCSGLQTAADLVQLALASVACDSSTDVDIKDKLQRTQGTFILPEVQIPDAATRFVAYRRLCKIHQSCQVCKAKKASKQKTVCPVVRAMIPLRDLVVLTVCRGRSTAPLRATLDDVLYAELRTKDLEPDEQGQIKQSFNKIRKLGEQRTGFDDAVREDFMYGPDVTPQQLDQLFAVYSSCTSAFPGYVSKYKAAGKTRRPRELPATRGVAAGASASSS